MGMGNSNPTKADPILNDPQLLMAYKMNNPGVFHNQWGIILIKKINKIDNENIVINFLYDYINYLQKVIRFQREFTWSRVVQ